MQCRKGTTAILQSPHEVGFSVKFDDVLTSLTVDVDKSPLYLDAVSSLLSLRLDFTTKSSRNTPGHTEISGSAAIKQMQQVC